MTMEIPVANGLNPNSRFLRLRWPKCGRVLTRQRKEVCVLARSKYIRQYHNIIYIYMDMYTYVDVQYVSYTHAHMMYFDGKIQEQNVFSFIKHVLRLSIGLLSITA